MQPVVGIDVAKGCSVIQAFKKRNEPYGRMETLQHGEEGFERLGEVLSILKETSGVEPVVVFEATGHYHRGLAGYLNVADGFTTSSILCKRNDPKAHNFEK